MKTIWETAKILHPISGIRRRAFIKGAYYILAQIEEILLHPQSYVSAGKSIEEGMIEKITEIIEELKK